MPDDPKTYREVDGLADLNQSGTPVKSRVGDAEQMAAICNRLVRDDLIRAERRVQVQGNIDGNAPYSRKAMLAAGRAGDSNVNWREGKGQILNAWTPYNDLRCEVPICIDGDLENGDPTQDAEMMRGFAEAFHRTVFQWQGFDRTTQLCDWTMLSHGIGIYVWDNEWDWRPRALLAGDAYVADETYSDLSNAEEFLVTDSITAGDLWRKIEDEKIATAAGWNVSAVKDAIMLSVRSDSFMLNYKWDRWQQALKNGDRYISQTQTKRIKLFNLFVQEMDGSISQHVCVNGSGGASLSGKGGNTVFLYSKLSKYESWDQCVCPFPYDVGSDGTWHSVKGLGTEIFAYCELSNRINNTIADLVVSCTKPFFQATTGADMQKLQMIKFGGGNIIPAGISPQSIDISRSIAPAMEVSQQFQSILGRNTGSYQEDIATPTVEETAKAVSIRSMNRSKLTKGAHNRHYRAMDRQYAEMWRRIIQPTNSSKPGGKEALKFQAICAKCVAKYYPDLDPKQLAKMTLDILKKVDNVRAVRSFGLGSAAMRFEIVSQLMTQIDRFDQAGQTELLRMFVSTMIGYHQVDALVPGQIRDTSNDESVAALEDSALAGPNPEVLLDPNQNHVLHLSIHIPSMMKDAQSLQQGADPRMVEQVLMAKGAHAHEHLVYLENNPTKQNDYRQFSQQLAELASITDQLRQQIEEQDQNSPPPEGAPDPDLVKVQGQLALKAQKQQGDLALKAQRQQADLQLKANRQRVELGLKGASTAANITIQDAKGAQDIRQSRLQAATKVNGSEN